MISNGHRGPEKYFTTVFQDTAIAALWLDKALGLELAARVRPDGTVDELRELALVAIQQHYAKRGRPPTRNELINEIIIRSRDLPADAKASISTSAERYVKSLRRLELPPTEDLREDLLNWISCGAYAEALQVAEAALSAGDFDSIVSSFRSAEAAVFDSANDPAVGLWAGWVEAMDLSGEAVERAAVTGIPKLDKFIARGGLPPGCLLTILAPPKFGKTTALINIARANVLRGLVVLYITLEIRTALLLQRVVSCFTGIKTSVLPELKEKAQKRMERARKKCQQGDLIIEEHPPATFTVAALRGRLASMELQGRKPDVLIVDYGDLLRAPRRAGGDDYEKNYLGVKATYEALRALAMEMDVPVFTASQCRREAATKETIVMEDIGEAYAKVAISDIILSLNQSAAEESSKVARFFIAGSRIGPVHRVIYLEYDRDRARIRPLDPEMEREWRRSRLSS